MANRKLTDASVPELTTLSDDDWGYVVDASDTLESPEGTSKKVKYSRLKAFLKPYFDTIYQLKIPYTTENRSNKQNSLATDGSGTKYPTVDAINSAISGFLVQITSKRYSGLGQTYTIPSNAVAFKCYINDQVQHIEDVDFISDLNTFTQTGTTVTFKKTITTGQRIIIDFYI